MRLIVDSNRIISALIKDGMSRAVISSSNLEFYTLDYVIDEVKKYHSYIMKKSGMRKEDIDLLLSIFMQNITVLSDTNVKSKMKEAMQVMKDIDIRDSPILACALCIPNDGIWTEDKHFDKQDRARVWKTKDILEFL